MKMYEKHAAEMFAVRFSSESRDLKYCARCSIGERHSPEKTSWLSFRTSANLRYIFVLVPQGWSTWTLVQKTTRNECNIYWNLTIRSLTANVYVCTLFLGFHANAISVGSSYPRPGKKNNRDGEAERGYGEWKEGRKHGLPERYRLEPLVTHITVSNLHFRNRIFTF